MPGADHKRWRKPLLALGAARVGLAVVAIPLAPMLFQDHFLLLVFMRPTKELFLAGGFLVRRGDLNLSLLVLAAIPLSVFGAWVFYALGRTYAREIENGNLPKLAERLLDSDNIKRLERALDRQGGRLIFLGRLAVMSSAGVAAAAGALGLRPKRFLPVDLAGGLASIAYTVGAGYFLGEAYEGAGPWVTGIGVLALLGFAYLLGRALKRS